MTSHCSLSQLKAVRIWLLPTASISYETNSCLTHNAAATLAFAQTPLHLHTICFSLHFSSGYLGSGFLRCGLQSNAVKGWGEAHNTGQMHAWDLNVKGECHKHFDNSKRYLKKRPKLITNQTFLVVLARLLCGHHCNLGCEHRKRQFALWMSMKNVSNTLARTWLVPVMKCSVSLTYSLLLL